MTRDATDDIRLILDGALTVRTIENVHATLREAIARGAAGKVMPLDFLAGEIMRAGKR